MPHPNYRTEEQARRVRPYLKPESYDAITHEARVHGVSRDRVAAWIINQHYAAKSKTPVAS